MYFEDFFLNLETFVYLPTDTQCLYDNYSSKSKEKIYILKHYYILSWKNSFF